MTRRGGSNKASPKFATPGASSGSCSVWPRAPPPHPTSARSHYSRHRGRPLAAGIRNGEIGIGPVGRGDRPFAALTPSFRDPVEVDRWRRVAEVLDAALTPEPAEWLLLSERTRSGDPVPARGRITAPAPRRRTRVSRESTGRRRGRPDRGGAGGARQAEGRQIGVLPNLEARTGRDETALVTSPGRRSSSATRCSNGPSGARPGRGCAAPLWPGNPFVAVGNSGFEPAAERTS